ncbi:MAG TPA: protein kinase [Ktedonobacterales bacterium]
MAGLEGTTLGPYQVISLLGKGGMGQVYRARDPRLGREVAIKVLSAALSQEHGYLERFRREARSIAQLNHPNIVSVYDFGEQGNTTYLVMPLIQGGTLRELLGQRGMLPLNEAVALVEQIGGALQYAHERGLIHRDVKPANILVGPDGRALLSDFGIVRVVQGEDSGATLTHTGAFVGSPEYAAPEMVLGQTIDRRVDIYALGMMLYQLLTGRTAFSANTPVQLLMMQAQVQPPNPRSINPAIPPAVEAVVLRALAKSPDQRYGSVAEMVAALRAAAGMQPVGVVTGLGTALDVSNLATMLTAPPQATVGAPAVTPLVPPLTPQPGGWAATPQPGGWNAALPEPPTYPPTFTTGLNRPYDQTLPNEQRRIPAGAAPTPPVRPGNKSRTNLAILVALAVVLILGGGGALAFGVSQGWFGSKAASTPIAQGSPAVPTATATSVPSPTATAVPGYIFQGFNFRIQGGDLQRGETADPIYTMKGGADYQQHEGSQGSFYRFGDAVNYGSVYSAASVIRDGNGKFIFVVLIDRFDTYQNAHRYFQRDTTLASQNMTSVPLGEEAFTAFLLVPKGTDQSFELIVRDLSIVITIAAVPSANQQDQSDYFISLAKAMLARGERCHYAQPDPTNPSNVQLMPGSPSYCS